MEDDFDFDSFIDYEGQANLPQPNQTDLSQTGAGFLSNNAHDCTLDDFTLQSTLLSDTIQGSIAQSSNGERAVASHLCSLMDNAPGGLEEAPASQESLFRPSIAFQPMDYPLFALHGVDEHGAQWNEAITDDGAKPSDKAQYTCHSQACGKNFGRLDSLRRHQLIHTGAATRFPCPHCVKYQDENAFLRKDKLDQHLRQFHRIGGDTLQVRSLTCPHEECQDGNLEAVEPERFASNAKLHRHIRRVHKTTPFECPVEDCNRVGAKGWFRAHDREVHQRKEHGNLDIVVLSQINAGIDAKRPAYLSDR